MNCRSLIIFLFFITCFFENFGQDFSNKGKDFWLGYGYHVRMDHAANNEPANVQNMILYLTSDRNTKVTVEVPGIGYQKVYQVNANSITLTDPLPKEGTQDSRIFDIGVFNRGIHVYSDEPIVAYAHIYNSSVSGATLLFPTATLGREYYSINYAQNANEVNSNSYFFVVAVEDNTTVEITPSAANRNNITPNTPFLVTLNKGQVYSVFGTTSGNIGTDLTGSKIRTVNSGTGGCKKIAVFSGMGKLSLGGNNTGSADNVFAQALPSSAWGLKYLTTPTGTQPNNYFRICVTDPTTNVKLNGVTIAKTFLQNNFFYELKNSTPLSTPARGQTVPNSQSGVFNLIEADKPITVAQYCTTEGQDGNPSSGGANGNGIGGDPEMIYLSPVEQTINKIAVYSADLFRIRESYINVVMKKQGVTSFMLDGVNRANYFLTHPQDANYSYAILRVSAGTHTLSSDSGFNAIAYGFGAFESYGYNAGTNIKDLYQFVTLKNDFASVDFPATCKETPFKLSITLPYKPTAMSWDFKNNPNQSPNAPVNITNPQPDSSFIRDNKTLYVYRLPETYSFSQTGTYPITVTVNNPTPDGCSGEQVINYDVVVYEKPKAKFSINSTGCPKDAVIFTDETDAFGRTVTKWNWIPGNGESYTTAQPTVQYTNDGNYQVNLRIITDIGCVSDTTQLLALNKPPVISFTYSDSCAKNNIVFKSLEQNNNHTITTWNWDFGNGQKLTANAPTNQQQTYLTAGSYNVSLQVETSKGCKSDLLVKTLVVNPLPQVAFNLPALCLPTGRALFFDGSTLAGETNPLFNYAWNFGDGNTSTEKNPIHEYATTGPFDVQLKVKTTKGCTDSLTQKLTTVYPQPKASFTHSGNACLRETTQLTNNSNGTGFALTKYYWNYGNGFVEGTAQPSYTYQNPGNYTIQLVVETEKGCLSDTAKANITIHALPKPDFTLTAPFCEKKPIIFTDASLANSGTITKWFWDFGNGNQRTESTANNPSETYNNFGSYTIKLALTNSFGCKSDTLEKNISIYPEPKVGFIVPEVCLKDAFAQFADTSKIADNSENQFTRLWNLNVENITPAPVAQTALTVANPSAVFTKAAKYLVGLQITSKNGCKAYLEQPFTINGSVPIAKLKIDQNKQFCSNDTVRVTDNSKVDFGVITKVIIYWDADNQPNWVTIDENPTSFDGFTGKTYAFKYPVNHFPQSTVSKRIKIVAYSGASCIDSSFETITLLAAPKLVFNPIASICNNISSKLITEALETSGISGIGIFKGTGISSNGNFSPTSLTP
ncbi:MAG: PKD domain-containing protein, partial [Chitinophagaceae bacterium]